MLYVRDVMTPRVVSVSETGSVECAMWRFAEHRVGGAPVLDRHGELVGVLSKSDLVDPMRESMRRARTEDGHEPTVGEAMTRGVWAVHPDDPAIEAVRLLVDKGIHRVLVVRGPGQLVGIVTPHDILRAIARGWTLGAADSMDRPSAGALERLLAAGRAP